MIWLSYLAWGIAGFALAILFLIMQRWTVNRITPTHVNQGKWLVIGGAVIRWLIFALLIILALRQAFTAALTVFISFLFTRMVILVSISQIFPVRPGKSTCHER